MRLSVEEAFRQYGDRVFSVAFSICQNKEDADDTVQDILYLTVNYKDGYATSPDGFIQPEEFR